MNSFWAVFKRELKSYFATPLAYVFLVIFLFFAAIPDVQPGEVLRDCVRRTCSRSSSNLPWLMIFMVPATAMRLWAEERKVGSIELLFTLPITITQAVLGKFLAAWIVPRHRPGADVPHGAHRGLSRQPRRRPDRRRLRRQLPDGRGVSGHRLLLLRGEQEPGDCVRAVGRRLRHPGVRRAALDAELSLDVPAGRAGLGHREP